MLKSVKWNDEDAIIRDAMSMCEDVTVRDDVISLHEGHLRWSVCMHVITKNDWKDFH